ncbi:hypothetical protein JMJ77_0007587 [Colletotrichum scovillei]|uniref:Uncharacterized protein n=1 Tax=Colletotrichum scovillei TaxID=1209932 RepID=A0A9P7ULA3_9PEZI|nr:hypothetical protein JMJ77_0007587 [Colletotrichum scovillei]KAG7074565.1 hypothetical protein JMJ76_0011041 [Colletotrichum scovillei]KAG7081530.1 hypothetical protein JMJ78_0003649 [Colletotrichum scovillei]
MSPPKPASPRILVALGDKCLMDQVQDQQQPSPLLQPQLCCLTSRLVISPPHGVLPRNPVQDRVQPASTQRRETTSPYLEACAAGTDSAILVLSKWSRACHRRTVVSLVLGRNRTRQGFRALALELLSQDHAARGGFDAIQYHAEKRPRVPIHGEPRPPPCFQPRPIVTTCPPRNQHQGTPHHDMLPFCEELARRIPTPHCETLDGEKADLSPPFPPLRIPPFQPVKHCERVLPNLPQRSLEPLIRRDPESLLAFAESRDEVQIPFPPASDGGRCTVTAFGDVYREALRLTLVPLKVPPRNDKHQVKQAAWC